MICGRKGDVPFSFSLLLYLSLGHGAQVMLMRGRLSTVYTVANDSSSHYSLLDIIFVTLKTIFPIGN